MREKKCILAIMAATMLMCTTGCGNAVPTGPINGESNTSDVTVDDNNNTDVADIDADADSGDVVGDETGDQTADTGSQTDDQGQGDEGEDEGTVTDGYNGAEFSDSGQPLLDHCWINKERTWRTKFDDNIGTYGKYLVGSRYEKIHLSDEAEKIYPELSRALLVANDLIATEQENLFISDCDAVSTMTEDEINSALDYQTYVRGKENELFIRRADGDVLSFMSTTYAVESIEIAQRTYRAFNYDVKTGNRIELSDIVKDIDKFNELL
ncbi:MAG: hypothetical protein K6G57_08135, partial [Lachnospiraceae bacterium]|nr:hypothetical protein [Lachnospiraceae bacterium]